MSTNKPDFIKLLGLKPKQSWKNRDDFEMVVTTEEVQSALEEKCKLVYADDSATLSSTFWTTEKQPSDKHQAFMFGITEIVKEPLKHESIVGVDILNGHYPIPMKFNGKRVRVTVESIDD